MDERRLKQYERIRKGYPRLFSDAQKIAKLIIKAYKSDMKAEEVYRYLQVLNRISSHKKGYRAIPDMVIHIFLDAKLTRDVDRVAAKKYYHDVINYGERENLDATVIKEYISLIVEDVVCKLSPTKK
jgi:deoxyadenosine/deoxycytidine kinase